MLLWHPCPGGEIGIRARLKILWSQGRVQAPPRVQGAGILNCALEKVVDILEKYHP
jgi:hypothetical protein